MPKASSLTELVSIRTLEKIQDNFSEATGIACVIRDVDGRQLTKISNLSLLWQEVQKHPEVEREANERLVEVLDKCAKTGQIQICRRYIDTYAFTVPMYIDSKIVAFFIGGLSRFGNPDMNICIQESRRLGIELDSFLELYLSLPLVTEQRLNACANLLKIIGKTIASLAREGTDAKAKAVEMKSLNNFLEQEIAKGEKELLESEERYRLLFNTINDGVYMTDSNGIANDINITGAKLLGYELDELIGSNFRNLYVNPEDRDRFLKKLYRDGHVEHFHPHIRLKNGQTRYFETNATVIRDKTGNIIGVQGIFRDLDSRTHARIKEQEEHDTDKTPLRSNTYHQRSLKQA